MLDSKNKTLAAAFFALIVEGKIREAYDRYVSLDFKHHNAYSKGDRESLMLAMEENEREFPGKKLEIQRAVEEGDLVVTHSRLQLKADMPPIAVVHILRFKDGKIVELWDVGQAVPADSINKNGAF